MKIVYNYVVLSVAMAAALSVAAVPTFAQEDWVNPGGMWMPGQLLNHADRLRALGLEINPNDLSDPSSNLLQAIIHLGYCSGSFVSRQGLIFTNHHCVAGMLSYLSNEDRALGKASDYVRDGFIAKDRSSERNAGPTERVFVTEKVTDVTEQILSGINAISDPVARMQLIRKRRNALIRKTESGRPHIRAELSAYYGGAKYFLAERMEIKDVRLVHAPPSSIGNFGGDEDNWKWPRQTGDFSILRAYVGKDGKPAPYSPDNVPYEPKNVLTVSAAGLKAKDLVLVAGYPGTTQRLLTFDQFAHQLEATIPMQIGYTKRMIQFLDQLGKENESLRIKTESTRKSLMNKLQNRESALENMNQKGFLGSKRVENRKLRVWIAEDASRQQKYGDVLDRLAYHHSATRKTEYSEMLYQDLLMTNLVRSSVIINRMAIERPKDDDERHASYQKREWKGLLEGETARQTKYDREIDIRRAELILQLALEIPKEDRPDWVSLFIDQDALTQGRTVREQLGLLYAATTLEDLSTRVKLLQDATAETLETHSDPLLRLGHRLTRRNLRLEEESDATMGELLLVIPRYIELLEAYTNRVIAPDANSTLRVTFGTVRGYTDPASGHYFHPFTTLSSMIAKAFDKRLSSAALNPYNVPQAVLDAANQRRFGRYADPQFGEVPVNLLSDVDTTGGNSGSAALNSRGELIGLLFDGSSHSLGGDWKFGANQRSILLDIRYALWLLDEVYGLKELVKEMKIVGPSCNDLLSGADDFKQEG